MKKTVSILLALISVICVLAGCNVKNKTAKEKKLSIVATVFPQYDWTREILGDKADKVNLTLLLDNGVDLHSYQPTAKDIVTVSSCDLFIYIGGESDEWVDDVLEESNNKRMRIISLMDSKNILPEETVEGMQDDNHDHYDNDDHDIDFDDFFDDDDDDDDDEIEYDEHIWLSLKNAQNYCRIIAENLASLDSSNADYYRENANNYIKKLSALDKDYEIAVNSGTKDTLVFADRFPFRYLTNDYGLKYFAAFKGCSAESEASFETISFLANKVKELNVPVIALEGSDRKIAKTVISTAKIKDEKIIILDSMQTTTSKDVANDKTYLSIASSNLEALKQALS